MFNTPEGSKVMKYGAIVLMVLAVFLVVQTIHALVATNHIGEGQYPVNTITVNGTAEQIVVPDIATFSFGAEMTGESVAAAQRVVTERMNAALDIIKAAGVEERDIKTIAYNINPHYEYIQAPCTNFSCPPGRQNLTGYDVSQTVEVKVRDTSKAGEILGKLGGAQVTNLSGLMFTVDEIEKVQDEARGMAIEDARKQAKILAKDLGVRLGDVVSFNEGYYPTPYLRADAAYDKGGVMMNEAMATPSLPMGENKVVSNVSVTYEIK